MRDLPLICMTPVPEKIHHASCSKLPLHKTPKEEPIFPLLMVISKTFLGGIILAGLIILGGLLEFCLEVVGVGDELLGDHGLQERYFVVERTPDKGLCKG